jgi:hypothetical protein
MILIHVNLTVLLRQYCVCSVYLHRGLGGPGRFSYGAFRRVAVVYDDGPSIYGDGNSRDAWRQRRYVEGTED